MEQFVLYMREVNIVTVAIRLTLAVIFGGIIGMERGKQGRAAGMRTHILVCLGAALTALIGFYANSLAGVNNDPLRVAAQVISGVGFLGVGTILIKGRFQIVGLTTAAGLWCATAIGIALGAGFYEGAIVGFALAMATITVIHKLEYRIYKRYSRFGIYAEIKKDTDVRRVLDFMSSRFKVSDLQVTPPRSGTAGNVGIEANIINLDFSTSPEEVSKILETEAEVVFALESL